MLPFRRPAATPTNSKAAPGRLPEALAPRREFFAFKAARLLGGAVRNVGARLVAVAAGPSADALRVELEGRAAGEGLATAVIEWSRLLTAAEDPPRYESADGALTFRAAFLRSRAFELTLAAAGNAGGGVSAAMSAAPFHPEAPEWLAFLAAATISADQSAALAAQLPELFALTRHFPSCRPWVEEAARAVKADARLEQLKNERTAAGARAEELRTALRHGLAAGSACGGGSGGGLGESCRASAEAVRLYGDFRRGLKEGVVHLRHLLVDRGGRLQQAQAQLQELCTTSTTRLAEATARREELQHQRGEAMAAPRLELEEIEQQQGRQHADLRAQQIEERKKQLQLELEEASQALGSLRDERIALLRRREDAVGEHRKRAEDSELQLQALRPAKFHRVVNARAAAMTESEIVAGLVKSTEVVRGLITKAQTSASELATTRGKDLATQRRRLEDQVREGLRRHAALEHSRLEAAGAVVQDCVTSLLDVARRRQEMQAMGYSLDDAYTPGAVPDRVVLRKLCSGLVAAKSAWEEAIEVWEGGEGGDDVAPTAMASKEDAATALGCLDEVRAAISECLDELQHADPALWELAMNSVGLESAGDGGAEATSPGPRPSGAAGRHGPEPSGPDSQLPHGWEAHQDSEGHPYFHNLVTGQTQWDLPTQDAAVNAGWRLVQDAKSCMWFYHNPYDGEGVWWPDLPTYPAAPGPGRGSGAAAAASCYDENDEDDD